MKIAYVGALEFMLFFMLLCLDKVEKMGGNQMKVKKII